MKRTGGFRRKTRRKFTKSKRTKGKISISKYFQTLEIGDKVLLGVEPAVQKGMYNPRFMRKSGVIKGSQGKCYKVQISDMGKDKTLIVHPIHLQKL